MAKLGVVIPDELDERLRAFVSWGRKGKLIEGLLILVVEQAEAGNTDLIHKAMAEYYDAH